MFSTATITEACSKASATAAAGRRGASLLSGGDLGEGGVFGGEWIEGMVA
jgi:hypothetical protein